MRFRSTVCLVLALMATAAFGQTSQLAPISGQSSNTTVLPVWNNENGQVEALLLIEPSTMPQLPSQRIIRPANNPTNGLLLNNGLQLRAGLSLEANPGMGVLCNSRGVISTVGSLAGNCLLTDFGNQSNNLFPGRAAIKGLARVQRSNTQLTGSLGFEREVLGGASNLIGNTAADRRLLNVLLGPNTATLDQRNASLVGQVSVGTQGWVSIGGTLAHARLITTDQLPGGLPPEWSTGSLSLGGGVGKFSGEITGQMIDIPGQTNRYSSVGAGVTWHTPWRAKLSIGAENLISHGKNPFGLPDANGERNNDEGRVPYVRYQQDL